MQLSGSVGRHTARFLLAPLVAFVAYLAFPRAGALLLHSSAVGSVAPTDVIAPVGFLVPKPEPQRVREAEALAATVAGSAVVPTKRTIAPPRNARSAA